MSINLNAKTRRSIFWLIILFLIVVGLIFTFRPQPIPVVELIYLLVLAR